MASARWRIAPGGDHGDNRFTSEDDAYSFVEELRRHWTAGDSPIGTVTVQFYAGRWQPYEYINFAEERQ